MLWKPSDDECLCLVGIISGGVLTDGDEDEEDVTIETGARFKDLRGRVGDFRGLNPRCVCGPWNIHTDCHYNVPWRYFQLTIPDLCLNLAYFGHKIV